jgi:hypothetical protein
LIKQQVAVVLSICYVVKNHNTIGNLPDSGLPASIQRVVVKNQPVRPVITQREQSLLNVSLPTDTKPRGVSKLGCRIYVGTHSSGRWQQNYFVATLSDQACEMPLMLSTNKAASRVTLP